MVPGHDRAMRDLIRDLYGLKIPVSLRRVKIPDDIATRCLREPFRHAV
jgi:hypothetical protein